MTLCIGLPGEINAAVKLFLVVFTQVVVKTQMF